MPTAPCIEIAQRFGELIAKEEYESARQLLTTEAQQIHSADDLKTAVAQMTIYSPGKINKVQAMEEFALEDWPEKQDEEIATIYTALEGDGFCEAVTVTVARDPSGIKISGLEWGRP